MMAQEKVNPATKPEKANESRGRVPMSLPVLKLEVPDIPGYHLHWMNGTPSRIGQALKAGYEFVDNDEVDINNFGLADSANKTGNTDLGTRVSVSAGTGLDDFGQEQRLFLMKIRLEYWEADQKALESRNESIAASLRGGTVGAEGPDGGENRYIPEAHRKNVANLFTPKTRRA